MPRTPSPDPAASNGEPGETASAAAQGAQAEGLSAAERVDALARLLSDAETAENELNGRSPDAARDFDAIMLNLSRFIDGDDPADTIEAEGDPPV